MANCCCKCKLSNKSSTICLGRCDLSKHHCKIPSKKRPVPKNMGWLYTAKDSPEHQLRCGWRPGHILCPVLRRIEQHNCEKACSTCPRTPCVPSNCCQPCPPPRCCPSRCLIPPCCPPRSCRTVCDASCTPTTVPLIRIIRHNGQYTISTVPPDLNTSPCGPNPLKYIFNNDDKAPDDAVYSIEAKYNDYQFDYTTSTSSFVIDFTPTDARPCRPVCGLAPCAPVCD